MKNVNGLSQLNENLKLHKSFKIYDRGSFFAQYDYDTELKRYQSEYGYLTIQDVLEIAKDETEERKIIFE